MTNNSLKIKCAEKIFIAFDKNITDYSFDDKIRLMDSLSNEFNDNKLSLNGINFIPDLLKIISGGEFANTLENYNIENSIPNPAKFIGEGVEPEMGYENEKEKRQIFEKIYPIIQEYLKNNYNK